MKMNNTVLTTVMPVVGAVGTGISLTGDLTFANDRAFIQADNEKMAVSEVIEICKLMKRVMIDIGKDEELSRRLPYIREASHEWLMQELTK